MNIYTKTGDKGETSLLGAKRVKKNCLEMVAIGEIDELNAYIGIVCAYYETHDEFSLFFNAIQHNLFVVGGELATVQTDLVEVPRLSSIAIKDVEKMIDKMQIELTALTQFILPGGSIIASHAFLARAVCRRAERAMVELSHHYDISEEIKQYLNRLSDFLFVFARYVNYKNDVEEVVWKK